MTRGARQMQGTMKKEIQMYLEAIALEMENKHAGGYPGGTTDHSLSRRSGKSIDSIQKSIQISGRGLKDTIGTMGGNSNLNTHEYGATLTPKNAQYLTVPLDAALHSDGTPKRLSLREWDNTFVGTSKDGTKKIVYLRLLKNKVVPLYLLVSSVEIKPRLGMREAANSKLSEFTTRLANSIINDIGASPR